VNAIAFMQREIQESAYRYQQEIEAKARIVVGVNEFVMDEAPPANLFQGDPTVARTLADRLGRLRESRHPATAAQALESVERAARGRDNLMPVILDAVRARLTLGEISDTLRKVFGVHQPSVVF
jgi:methylmalonyl-CoA mutase N-terminal domain/subunit